MINFFVKIGDFEMGFGCFLLLIVGFCVIENEWLMFLIVEYFGKVV